VNILVCESLARGPTDHLAERRNISHNVTMNLDISYRPSHYKVSLESLSTILKYLGQR